MKQRKITGGKIGTEMPFKINTITAKQADGINHQLV